MKTSPSFRTKPEHRSACIHDSLLITGEEQAVQTAAAVIRRLLILLKKRERIDRSRIRYAIELAAEGRDELIEEIMSDVIAITYRGKQIKSKTLGQSKYGKRHEKQHDHLRDRPCRNGKNLSCNGNGCNGV